MHVWPSPLLWGPIIGDLAVCGYNALPVAQANIPGDARSIMDRVSRPAAYLLRIVFTIFGAACLLAASFFYRVGSIQLSLGLSFDSLYSVMRGITLRGV